MDDDQGTIEPGDSEVVEDTNKELNRNSHSYLDSLNYDTFRSLHRNVLNADVTSTVSANDTVDALKQIAELIIWSDANNYEYIFEYFCENNMMDYMANVLSRSTSRAVRIQLVQTISMLIHNIQNERYLYYLLSNNYINTLISVSDVYGGGDVSSWTVSLLKTLSGLLNEVTIKFFFQEENDKFPLLDQSTRFLTSNDSMKRAHVMTILLNILRVNDPAVTHYVINRSRILIQLPLFLRQCWCRLNHHVKKGSLSTIGKAEENIIVECDDVFCFIQELMDLEINDINSHLLTRLFNICFIPLMKHLLKTNDVDLSIMDILSLPEKLTADYYRVIYQRLCHEIGLTDRYAHNKSELFSGGQVDDDLKSKTEFSMITTPATTASDDLSDPFTPRSDTTLTLHSTTFLPNVAYFILVISLRSAKRKDIRRPLLLLLLCPLAPRDLLELVQGNESISVPVSPRESAAMNNRLQRFDEVKLYGDIRIWEKEIFDEQLKVKRSEYVCNIIMGEFLSEALLSLPHSDSRLLMLLLLLSKLQDDYTDRKLIDTPEYELCTFILMPSGKIGLQIYLQIWNALSRHLTTSTLRIPILRLAVYATTKYIDYLRTNEHPSLGFFIEEIMFHLDASLDVLRNYVLKNLDLTLLSLFFDEWVKYSKTISTNSYMRYIQSIYDPNETDYTKENNANHRESLTSWLFRDHRDNKKPIHNRNDLNNYSWKISLTHSDTYRKYVHASLLVRELYSRLDEVVVGARMDYIYDMCPLFYNNKESLRTADGHPLSLGLDLQLDGMNALTCTMNNNGDKKKRLYVSHSTFFLLLRSKTVNADECKFGEITCIHPLWNTTIKNVNEKTLSITISVTWHTDWRNIAKTYKYDSLVSVVTNKWSVTKGSSNASHPVREPCMSDILLVPAVTDFDLVFQNAEEMSSVVSSHSKAKDALLVSCISSLKQYFYDKSI